MTTISHNRKRKNSPLLPLLLGIGGIALALGIIFFRGAAANIVWHIAEPGLFVSSKTGGLLGGVLAQFSSKASLYAENNRLRDALAISTIQAMDRDLLSEENTELRVRLGETPTTTSAVFAQVVLRPPGTPYDTLIIDAGRGDGVRVGNLVSPGGTIVIGTVEEVYDSTSRVILFSAPGAQHDGLLDGTIPVSVQGQGGGSMEAEVPAGVEVRAGSVVTFPGITQQFSARVVSVETKEGSSFSTVYMALPVNIFSLRYVEVLKNTAIYEQK